MWVDIKGKSKELLKKFSPDLDQEVKRIDSYFQVFRSKNELTLTKIYFVKLLLKFQYER